MSAHFEFPYVLLRTDSLSMCTRIGIRKRNKPEGAAMEMQIFLFFAPEIRVIIKVSQKLMFW
jgi:hypothetical protein